MFKLNALVVLVFSSLSTVIAQEKEDDIIMKDGTRMGDRKVLVAACADGMKGDVNSSQSSKEVICDCMLKTFAEHFTMREFTSMVNKPGFNYEKLFNDKKRPELGTDLYNCISQYSKVVKAEDTSGSSSDFVEAAFIKGCVEVANKGDNAIKLKDYDIEKYCACTYAKIRDNNIPLGDVAKMKGDNGSVLTNEVVLRCLEDSKKQTEVSPAVKNDVVGTNEKEDIILLKALGIYRLRLKIGRVEKYYTLDSGASDLLVDKTTGKELLSDGAINSSNYIGEGLYELANGKAVKAKKYNVSNIVIGSYIVNNVTVGVLTVDEGSMLCGKSILDKFSKWSVDNENSILHLVK